jgi:hypothetical protein
MNPMKKSYIVLMAICMMAGNLSAQKTYLRLGIGGGVGLKQYQGQTWADQTSTNTSNKYEIKSTGLGSGLNVNLAFGYMFSENVGIELGVNEFIGLNKKIHYSNTTLLNEETSDTKISGMMLQLIPAIVISPGGEKLSPYARLGMIIGILPSVVQKENSTYVNNPVLKATSTTEVYNFKQYGGVALGFTAAGGVAYKLNDHLKLYAEMVFNGITYAPTKGKVKEWTIDGVDRLATATTKDKEWTYEKKYDNAENIPDANPDKKSKISQNFSNVELNIGVKFNF